MLATVGILSVGFAKRVMADGVRCTSSASTSAARFHGGHDIRRVSETQQGSWESFVKQARFRHPQRKQGFQRKPGLWFRYLDHGRRTGLAGEHRIAARQCFFVPSPFS
ncbi:hypothetical protein F5Y07DRAFT_57395 [Xylaria sp. FL0933]|nr:hypothetical protein F5Y07DRAFT_57395 [Xylaria sp. FL0933]KAI1351293.1 hypothetical protein F5Y01DRAFT_283326 [Xylaria sp. FL0043]